MSQHQGVITMNTKIIYGTAMAVCLMASSAAMATDYMIDKKGQHASITFKASHLGYSYIMGRFNDFSGKFSHDAATSVNSKVNVVINSSSIDTNHAARDKHLRSADFFDTSKYPKITFASTAFTGDTLTGDLSMHGVTKSITMKTRHIGEGKDPWGGYRSGFEGSVTINAPEFGLPDYVGDIEVLLNVEGVRQ